MTTQKTVRVVEFVLLMFSLALQIVCLAAPGWMIQIEDSYDKYYGIFYFTRCDKLGIEECETTSWHDDYHDSKARTTSSDTSAVDADYHYHVREQIFVLAVLVATIVCVLRHRNRLRTVENYRLPIPVIESSFMALTSALMISRLSVYYITHRFYLHSDSIDVGFPYCVLLYTVAFISNVITYILYTREALKWDQPGPSPAEGVGTEGIILSVPGSNLGYSNMAATYAKN